VERGRRHEEEEVGRARLVATSYDIYNRKRRPAGRLDRLNGVGPGGVKPSTTAGS